MTVLNIKYPKYCGEKYKGKIKRSIIVTPLKIIGDLKDTPIDKAYQSMYEKWHNNPKCLLKLELIENDYIKQRDHYLYKSSKKGYYCVVCQHKVYFEEKEILALVESEE